MLKERINSSLSGLVKTFFSIFQISQISTNNKSKTEKKIKYRATVLLQVTNAECHQYPEDIANISVTRKFGPKLGIEVEQKSRRISGMAVDARRSCRSWSWTRSKACELNLREVSFSARERRGETNGQRKQPETWSCLVVVEWQILVRKLAPAELTEAARRKLLKRSLFSPQATMARKRGRERERRGEGGRERERIPFVTSLRACR